MTNEQINAKAEDMAMQAIIKQAEKGCSAEFKQARTSGLLAYVIGKLLVEENVIAEDKRKAAEAVVIGATFKGPLLQGSTLLAKAVKKGIYQASAANLDARYKIED